MTTMIEGQWRHPRNTAAHQKGGIHDDETATKLGFIGGTVAGSIHMEQFLPLCLQAYGESWWRSGVLSTYFKQATVDLQPVRCFLQPSATGQARVWMENEANELILEGTAQLGECAEPTALNTRLQALREPEELRILREFEVDQQVAAQTRVEHHYVDQQLAVITESHDYFVSADALGARALPYTQVLRIFDPAEQLLAQPAVQPFVGLYGAIEIAFENGPVLASTDYQSTCTVVGLSDSPKTEVLWRASRLTLDGVGVARMLKMDRLMKNSSPLWAT